MSSGTQDSRRRDEESKGFLIRFDAKKFNTTSLAHYNMDINLIYEGVVVR